MKLIKVGGSCLLKGADQVAHRIVESFDAACVIIHGYSHVQRQIMENQGIKRLPFITASGKNSGFTTHGVLAASHLGAFLAREQLLKALRDYFPRVHGIMGYEGCLEGRRNSKIRYKENGVLKVFRDDFSGRIEQINWSFVKPFCKRGSVVVLTPLLADCKGGILVCDADHAAAEIAVFLGLSHYTILTDTDGYKVDGQVVGQVPSSRIAQYSKHASGGMLKKIYYIAQALNKGVHEVHLLNGAAWGKEQSNGTLFYADSHLTHPQHP